jgi:hypothetical protein
MMDASINIAVRSEGDNPPLDYDKNGNRNPCFKGKNLPTQGPLYIAVQNKSENFIGESLVLLSLHCINSQIKINLKNIPSLN